MAPHGQLGPVSRKLLNIALKPSENSGPPPKPKVQLWAPAADRPFMAGPSAIPTRHPAPVFQTARYRCLECEVAWTATEDPGCWVCGSPGDTLRTAHALREDDHLHLDFE